VKAIVYPFGRLLTSVRARRRALVAACLLAGLAILTPASAADAVGAEPTSAAPAELTAGGLLDIQAVLGFSGTFRLGRWTPLTVTVSNRGNALVGRLDVRVADGDALRGDLYTTTHRRALELPRDARKRFRFTIYLESLAGPLTIRVTSGGREVARRTVDLRSRFATSRLVLVLGRDADLDYLNDSAGKTLRVLYPHPEMLPDRWQGYDGIDAIVVHETSLEPLSARQFEALDKWIARGGVLAVSGGPDYTLLRTPRIASLLPATPVGLMELAAGAEIGEALGVPIAAPKAFNVTRLAGIRGRVRHRAGRAPLVVEADRGRGRVVYLAFDVTRYPFDRAAGMKQVWLNVLRLPPSEPMAFAPAASPDDSAVRALVREAATGFPDHATVLVFLTLYLGILLTGYRVRPAGRAGRWMTPWLTWASPTVFAPAAYLVFGPLLFPAGTTAVVVSVVAPYPRGPYATLDVELGMYANRASRLELRYDGVAPGLRPAPGWGGPANTADWVFRDERGGSADPADENPYRLHVLRGTDVIAYALSGSLAETGSGMRVRLRNGSGRAIRAAWLLLDDRAYALGSIPADADLDRPIGPKRGGAAEYPSFSLRETSWAKILAGPAGLPAREARAAEGLLRRKLAELERQGRPGDALLVGFSSSPVRLGGASAAWQRADLTLVLYPLPVTRLTSTPEETGRGTQ
jgi:hypothetical protein